MELLLPRRSAKGPQPRLTEREQEYIRYVLQPEEPTVHEIATRMDLHWKTVENHRANAYRKLDVHTRTELYHKAVKLGIVPCSCGGMLERKSNQNG